LVTVNLILKAVPTHHHRNAAGVNDYLPGEPKQTLSSLR